MKQFYDKSNEQFSAESYNISIAVEISPKQKVLDLDEYYPKFMAKLSHLIDKETTNHVEDK